MGNGWLRYEHMLRVRDKLFFSEAKSINFVPMKQDNFRGIAGDY